MLKVKTLGHLLKMPFHFVVSEMKITLPKACISCTNYEPKGKKEDPHTPFSERILYSKTMRVQYGQCNKHCKEVFCTEICNAYEQDELVDVVEVGNRPEPMVPHQENLI